MRSRPSRRAGFTLIELMIAVAIVGVLAMLAIPSFNAYIQRSRMAEGYSFLGEIRQRQESYRSEFGQYVTAPWHPQSAPMTNGSISGWTYQAAWAMLGAVPDGPTRFIYRTNAAVPGADPAGCPAGIGANDFSFCAQAQIDLDADGDIAWLETTSLGPQVAVTVNGTTERLSAGWE